MEPRCSGQAQAAGQLLSAAALQNPKGPAQAELAA